MVEFGLRELHSYQEVHELMDKRIDLGYVGIRFPEVESELVFECVRQSPFWVALPPGHRLVKQRITLRALQNETFISLRRAIPAYHNWLMNLWRSSGFVPSILQEEPDGALIGVCRFRGGACARDVSEASVRGNRISSFGVDHTSIRLSYSLASRQRIQPPPCVSRDGKRARAR